MGKPANSQLTKTLLGAGALVLLVLVVYLPVIHCGFVWDDDASVTENMTLRSLYGLYRTWTDITANQQYYPLTHTSFWMEYHLWGLKPLGYHLDNVLLHAIGALLIWFILRRLSMPGAWLAAAIFALHPVNVESVAWITERKNTLSGVFYFSALLAYLHYAGIGDVKRAGNLRVYGLALGLFACALFSKTATSTLPAAILLILWWKRDRLAWRDALDLLPFFALAFVMGRTTAWLEKYHAGAVGETWSLPFAGKVLVAGKALAFYAGKLFLPINIIHIYPRWQVNPSDAGQYVFPVIVMAVTVALWLLRKRIGKTPLVAVLYFELTLAPALGFFNVYFMRYSYVQDHFQYLASAGLIALAAGVITVVTRKARGLKIAVPAIILILLGTQACLQIPKYKDEETLWNVTIAKNPSAWIAHNNLGILLYRKGDYDEAITQYRKVMTLEPSFSDVYINLGAVFLKKGQIDRAIESFNQAVKLTPRDARAHYCLGESFASKGRYDEAIAQYETALKTDPRNTRTRTSLAQALIETGKNKEAAQQFAAALKLDPTMEEARAGIEVARQGSTGPSQRAAADHYKKGVRLEGEGDFAGAMREYRKAIELNPNLAEAHFSLGVTLENQGRRDKAIEEYRAAVRIRPNLVSAHNNLAVAYYSQGDGENAWKEVKICRQYSYQPNAEFLAALSQLMPEP